MEKLNGKQIGTLRDGIVANFLQDDFEEFLHTELDREIRNLTTRYKAFPNQVFDVINRFNYDHEHGNLVLALFNNKPKVKEFALVAFELRMRELSDDGTAQHPLPGDGLEAIVNSDPMLNPSEVVEGVLTYQKCVCRIMAEANGKITFGTGFLIAPDKVLTNYHVIESAFKEGNSDFRGTCKFDFATDASGAVINPGSDILFNASAIIATSKYGHADTTGSASIDDVPWPAEELDYALIQLDSRVGEEEIPFLPGTQNNAVQKRGWIAPVPLATADFSNHVLIMQHPKGQAVKITFGFNKGIGLSQSRTRYRYAVNTFSGSSGSPCFDHRFRWIAMHNMGDPEWNPSYNQGITAESIINDLNTKQITL